MPKYVHPKDESSLLAAILAVRLREIEAQYPNLREYAKAAGVSFSTLHSLRTGEGNPTFRSVERIASKLGISVLALLGVEAVQVSAALAREGLDLNEIRQFIARKKEVGSDCYGDTRAG